MRCSIFDEIAPQYSLKTRLSSDCIRSIIDSLSEQITPRLSSHLLDIGGGNGQLTSEFLYHTPIKECSIVDLSRSMLRIAKERLSKLNMSHQVNLVQGDAEILPIGSGKSGLVLMSFILHLLADPQTALLEVRRVLFPDGRFFLVTYDLPDLSSQIYHKYLPGYYEIDSKRYPHLDALENLMVDCGLGLINLSKHPYVICHESVDEVISFVRTRPFSTLLKYSESGFGEAISIFEKRLRLQFGVGPVEYTCRVTLVSATPNTE